MTRGLSSGGAGNFCGCHHGISLIPPSINSVLFIRLLHSRIMVWGLSVTSDSEVDDCQDFCSFITSLFHSTNRFDFACLNDVNRFPPYFSRLARHVHVLADKGLGCRGGLMRLFSVDRKSNRESSAPRYPFA